MIEGKKVLAIIPARGGSKGIPRKNVTLLGGKPLIAWTIEAARNSRYLDRCILSSEDSEIIEVAQQWECEVPFVRPVELAADTTPGIDPILHALTALPEQYDYLVLLQPTSPLRSSLDIDSAIETVIAGPFPACVSVTQVAKSPRWMYRQEQRGQLVPFLSDKDDVATRQELEKLYLLNGAVYVAQVEWFLKEKSFLTGETVAYVMPEERSVDVDTPIDLKLCELLLGSG